MQGKIKFMISTDQTTDYPIAKITTDTSILLPKQSTNTTTSNHSPEVTKQTYTNDQPDNIYNSPTTPT